MATEQTEALVLRLVEYSETSFIVTLYTREFGQVAGIAKGAKRPKSPFEGALDLLAICRVMLIRKSHDSLDLLTEAKLQRRFRAGARDLSRLHAGYYLVELLRELTDHGDSQPEIFDLAAEVHHQLHEHPAPWILMARFEAQLLKLTGHFPLLQQCVGCNQMIDPNGERKNFSLSSGGIVCPVCRTSHRGIVSLTESARRIWIEFADHTDWDVPSNWNRGIAGELRGLTQHWIELLIGHRLRMHEYIRD